MKGLNITKAKEELFNSSFFCGENFAAVLKVAVEVKYRRRQLYANKHTSSPDREVVARTAQRDMFGKELCGRIYGATRREITQDERGRKCPIIYINFTVKLSSKIYSFLRAVI